MTLRRAWKLALLLALLVWIALGVSVLPILLVGIMVAPGGEKAGPGAFLALWIGGFLWLWHELTRDPSEPRGDYRACRNCLGPIEVKTRKVYCDDLCRAEAARKRRERDHRASLHESYGDVPEGFGA